jgi:hypothetical protein
LAPSTTSFGRSENFRLTMYSESTLVTSMFPPVPGSSLLVARSWLLVAGYSLLVICCWLFVPES